MNKGPGAWYVWPRQQVRYYQLVKPNMGALPEHPVHLDVVQNWAVLSIQEALISNGEHPWTAHPMGIFGTKSREATKSFQSKRKPLIADGIVGPNTAKELFKLYVNQQEMLHAIPNHWVCGIIGHESGWDPGAIGYVDNRDRGLGQINSGAHPDVTDGDAFNAQFAVAWVAQRLATSYAHMIDEKYKDPWKLAVAAHNCPACAEEIGQSGTWTQDMTNYVSAVQALTVGC